jgi:hypothetical protein
MSSVIVSFMSRPPFIPSPDSEGFRQGCAASRYELVTTTRTCRRRPARVTRKPTAYGRHAIVVGPCEIDWEIARSAARAARCGAKTCFGVAATAPEATRPSGGQRLTTAGADHAPLHWPSSGGDVGVNSTCGVDKSSDLR